MLLALSFALSACAIYFHFYFCLFTVNNWWTCEQSVIALLFFSPFLLFLILKFNSIQLECCCYSAILSCVILILFKCFFVFQLLLGTLPNCENNKTTATITSGEMCSWVERSFSLSFFLSFFSFFNSLFTATSTLSRFVRENKTAALQKNQVLKALGGGSLYII